MSRKMLPIEVGVREDGLIAISQEAGAFDEDALILVHPEQVDLLVKWITDAQNELQKQ